jgi:predicted lipoprotein with Yx(FWY)xxD motif
VFAHSFIVGGDPCAPLSGNKHKIFAIARQHARPRSGFLSSAQAGMRTQPFQARSQFAERAMSRNLNVTRYLGALALLALSVACSKKTDSAADTAALVVAPDTTAAVAVTAAPGGPVTLTVATKPGVGVYLTDAAGRAVYVMDDGTGAKVACTGTCLTEFKPVAGNATAAAGASAVKADLIGVTTLPDGTIQVTYAGKPLYYANADQGAGAVSEQGMKMGKTTSYLVSPSGNKITSKPK